eukprot:518622_1
MTIQSSKHSSVTTPHPGPTSDIESPPICSDSSIAPESPRSQTATSRTSPTSPKSSSNKSSSDSQLVFILPMLSYILFIGAALCGNLSVLGIKGCEITGRAGPSCYFIAKMFMYLVFIYRIYFVYSNSYFHYNTKVLIILSIIVILCTTFEIIMTGVTTNGKIMVVNNYSSCIALIPYGLAIFAALFDLTISGICLFLFIRPLLLVSKQQNDKETKIELKGVVLKYTTLSIVAILSTFIVLIVMAIFDMTGVAAIDVCCNCLCIMFFNTRYDQSFKTLCCGAIYVMSMIMNRKQNTANNNENTVTNSTNQHN